MKKAATNSANAKHEKKSRFSIFFLLANLLFITVLLISIWKTGTYLLDVSTSNKFNSRLRNTAVIMDEAAQDTEGRPQASIPSSIDFDKLHEISENAVAWLYAPGTKINYVVAQARDNDYYLHRLLDGTAARGGTLFADYRSSADLSDWNTVIYGHNMKDGTMFKALLNYRDPEYYKNNPVMYLYTPGHRYKLELIAGYTADEDDPIYLLPASRQDKDEIIKHALEASTFISDLLPAEEDKLVTLSTCAYDYDDARYVVIGRLREE